MNKEYEKIFNQEIERILNELYNNSGSGDKQLRVNTEYKYIQYLEQHDLVLSIKNYGNLYTLSLRKNGYDVFEKYKGWLDYRKNVIDIIEKTEKAKSLAQRFWWLPIIISAISLILSIIAIIVKS